ncbi:beta strand repeat-containing protein [Caulobacter soli]|uniref:beta strand repeat-containing protein n=1 Tax=Caulobacter soli TaxID=2708539 RepID=UPI0013EB95C5|nr:cadherin domain-containing protein [Caulobacter soli]
MYLKNLGAGDDIYAGDEGAPDNADLVNGGAGNDDLSGGLDADTLNGQDDNDRLDGGAGDDILDGGDGDDTAVFSGAAGDYSWSGDNVSTTITGPDGTDTLYNVEHLQFGSTVVDLPAPNVAPGAPADDDAAANTVSEDAVNGAVVAGLTLSAIDPDAGQTLTWSLLDDADGRFAIDAATGVVTVADASKLNFETATSHQITVQVSDGAAISSASFVIAVTNVAPGAPADTDAAANTVSEDAVNGAVVAGLAIAATDPNGGALTYSLVDDAGGRFTINAATGVVTVADASLLDYDVAASHQITVRSSDGTASAATDTTFTIDLVNAAPTTPTDADTALNAVSEGAANGDLVGVTALASEPKTGAVTYSLANDAGGRFAIDAATGVVTVADAGLLNFETAASHQITVRATDAQGAFSSQVFTIAVTNVANDAPVDGDATANTISEGAVNGAVVAGLSISAADVHGGPLVYSLLDNAGGRFAINAATGVVTVANANLLSYEAATSHQIIIQAASGTQSASAAFVIDVLNLAPAVPTDVNGAPTLVSEHATNGTVVGGLTIAAPDPHGGAVTYSLTNDAGGRFAINATTGVVTVANASLLDHDTQASHTITVQASDGLLSSTGAIVINLIDEIDSYWTGTAGNDSFTVPDVQDWQLSGLGGADTLVGGVGDDILIGGAGNDNLYGGGGNDTFLMDTTSESDIVDGGAGTDTLKFTASNVILTVRSMAAIEVIDSGGFSNVGFRASSGNDNWDFSAIATIGSMSVYAGAGNDTIMGTAGNDIILGEAGNDVIYGLDGNDIIDGGEGADACIGGNGDDLMYMYGTDGWGSDGFDGGAGFDEVRASVGNRTYSFAALVNVEKISSGGLAGVWLGMMWPGAPGSLDFSNIVLDRIAGISGGVQGDTIIGSAGDDTISGAGGTDILSGGLGNDTFIFGGADSRYDTIDGGGGWDKLIANGNNAAFEIQSMTGVEEISTNGFSNVIFVASQGDDVIDLRNLVVTGSLALVHLNGGNDTFYGTTGTDIVDGGTGFDFIDTGDGDDIIHITTNPSIDQIYGGNGWDRVEAIDNSIWINFIGLHGIEEIRGNSLGNTQIVGTANDDVIDLRDIVVTRVQWIDAGLGNDIVYGSAGYDNVVSNGGNDIIYTGGGNDRISFYQSAGISAVDGGDGYDTLVAASDYSIINISSMTSIEAIIADSINGTSHTGMGFTDGADNFDLSGVAVSGITFTDLRGGDDIFIGSSAGERIIGGLGRDVITGGGGADNFDFNTVAEIDHDVITDFTSGVDRIDFANIDTDPFNSLDQAFTLIGTSAFTGVRGQLRYDVSGGSSTLQGDVNGDGLADFYLHVTGVTSFTASDFFL